MDDDTLIAHTWNGALVLVDHGGPVRVIISKLYTWKGAKWASEIIFLVATSSVSGKCAAIRTRPIRGPMTALHERH